MQQLNPSEISEIIKTRIDSLDVKSEARNEGTIVSVTDGIIRIHGLADVMYGEMIEFDGGIYGMALNLERDSVGAVVLGEYKELAEGQSCRCTSRILEVPVGPELQGRVVDALGAPIDGKGPVKCAETDALKGRAGRYCASVGRSAGANWTKGYRCYGPDWSRAERAHNR